MKRILLFLLVFIACYSALFTYQLTSAHPYRLIYAVVYGNWNGGSGLLRLPFRQEIIEFYFNSVDIKRFEGLESFEFFPYTILSFRDDLKHNNSYQKNLENVVVIFISRGMNIDKRDGNGCTSLELSKIFKDSVSERFLLMKGASSFEGKESFCRIE